MTRARLFVPLLLLLGPALAPSACSDNRCGAWNCFVAGLEQRPCPNDCFAPGPSESPQSDGSHVDPDTGTDPCTPDGVDLPCAVCAKKACCAQSLACMADTACTSAADPKWVEAGVCLAAYCDAACRRDQ